ncbi:MAG: hypothetical protein WC656_06605 [Sulfurimonas sp.]|jgi:hypothetical protein
MSKYIVQNMTKFLNYEHFIEYHKNIEMSYFDEKKTHPTFSEIYDCKYLMVVAEPGYGKTRLFKQLVLQGSENNKIFFVDSKKVKSSILESIQQCKIVDSNISEEQLQKKAFLCNIENYTLEANTIICLDALDELPYSNLHGFFEQVEKFISEYPDVKIFLSCRTHHLKKIEYDLSSIAFEYITLDSFYGNQIIDYLKSNDLSETTIKQIEDKSKLTNLFGFLSIPRYLYYFSEIIKDKKIDEIINLSRSEIFEEFIYRKIDKERSKKYPESENHTIKRVLEELALVMKIFQVSQISKDDFFTVFKELSLGNIFTGKGLIEKLTEKSLLKDNIDFLEFENQEFLDFLAAKELNRFEKVEQVFFDFAVEPHLKEVFTNWFYVMPFVLEQQPFMINIVLDFLEKNFDRVLRERYFDVITSIDVKFLDKELKARIFNIVFDYYTAHNQWLYANKLVYFYDEEEHYQKILDSMNGELDDERIKVRNAIEIIKELSKHNRLNPIQLKFWKEKFLEWLKLDKKKYKHLHSAIISSCSVIMKNDFEWIKSIYFIFEEGIEVQHDYSRTCHKIAPNDEFSIDIYFKTDKQFKKNQIDRASRLDDNVKYICRVNTLEGIKYILEKLTSGTSEKYLSYIFHASYKSSFHDDLKLLVSNIQDVINDEIIKLLKTLVVNLLIEIRIRGIVEARHLFSLLLDILIKKDEMFIQELLEAAYQAYQNKKLHYYEFENILIWDLSKYFNCDNFDVIYKELKKFESDKRTLENIMCNRLFQYEKLDEKVKKKIKKIYSEELKEYEVNRKKYKDKNERDEKNKQLGLCKQWEHKIEPEPEMFATDLFNFYLHNKERLEKCENFETNRNKTIELAKDVIKHNNPLDGKIEVDGNSTTYLGVPYYYKKAIKLLEKENIELEQDLIDNVFRYLPFNINSEYETTLKLAKNPFSQAVQDILDVYAGKRKDDLNIAHPENFIKFYKITKIKEAEDLLLQMLYNSDIKDYIRTQIIELLPQEVLTKEIIQKYIQDKGEEDELYEDMLIALIKNFDDKDTIEKAFEIIIKKGKEAEISEGERSLFGTSLDLDRTYNKLAYTLSYIEYDIEKDKELLLIAIDLRDKGKDLNGYFFEEIVFKHVKYLNHKKSFAPLIEIEKFLQENKSRKNIYRFEHKFKELKDIYLEELAKPKHVMEAIKSYKKSKENEYIAVNSPLHLLEIIKESISNEITHWIEVEGAYKHIEELAKKNINTNAEDFIQKTLKPQIELALLKRGLRHTDIRIKREEQTLDDKRADFTISYGFVGSILLELKLSHNPESKSGQKAGQDYKEKLKNYVKAISSDFGIFIIFNIQDNKVVFDRQIQNLAKYYDDEHNISVLGIDCKVE